jgi:predicted Zn-dependent protease
MRQTVLIGRCPLILIPMLVPLAWIAGGCSAFRPSDQAVIAQADQVHTQLAAAVIHDPQVEQYMNAIGARIIQGAQDFNKDPEKADDKRNKQDNAWLYQGNIEFHLVNSKTLNAFTTGGQHVYIYNELFQQARSEDELAAVMAHEFAHIYCRHVARGESKQFFASGISGAAQLAAMAVGSGSQVASLGAAGVGAAAQFLNMGFTRGDEDEADKYGFSFYIRAGWDPNHFADFFQRMIDLGYDKTPEAVSDHPKLSNRVANTERRIQQVDPREEEKRRRPDIASPQQFQQVQQRAVAASKNTPDDKSLQAAQLMLAAFPSCVAPADVQPEQQRAKQTLLNAGGASRSGNNGGGHHSR